MHLRTCVAFKGLLKKRVEEEIADIVINMLNGETIQKSIVYGTIEKIPLKQNETADVEKASRQFDVGAELTQLFKFLYLMENFFSAQRGC